MKITKKNGTISVYDDQKVVSSILKANAQFGHFRLQTDVLSLTDNVQLQQLSVGDHQ